MVAMRRGLSLAPAVLAGLALGLVMPRGPMTTGQSVTALLVALVVGGAGGWLLRTRWAALLAPVVFAGVFELVRLGAEGPSVDAIGFDSIGAIAAAIAGRGFDALVILLPMVVAALWGAAAVRRSARPATTGARFALAVRRASLVAATLVVVLTGAALVRPVATEPVLGDDGRVLPGSIVELVTIPIGGVDQSMMIRDRKSVV